MIYAIPILAIVFLLFYFRVLRLKVEMLPGLQFGGFLQLMDCGCKCFVIVALNVQMNIHFGKCLEAQVTEKENNEQN